MRLGLRQRAWQSCTWGASLPDVPHPHTAPVNYHVFSSLSALVGGDTVGSQRLACGGMAVAVRGIVQQSCKEASELASLLQSLQVRCCQSRLAWGLACLQTCDMVFCVVALLRGW